MGNVSWLANGAGSTERLMSDTSFPKERMAADGERARPAGSDAEIAPMHA
jgi:hypothetical protein